MLSALATTETKERTHQRFRTAHHPDILLEQRHRLQAGLHHYRRGTLGHTGILVIVYFHRLLYKIEHKNQIFLSSAKQD